MEKYSLTIQQLLITVGKLAAGIGPGSETWTPLDQVCVDSANVGILDGPVERFANECITHDAAAVTTGTELYRAFEAWCEKNGEVPMGPVQFMKRLRNLGFPKSRTARSIVYRGVALASPGSASSGLVNG